MAQIIAVCWRALRGRGWRLMTVLTAAGLLAACSAVQLGYNQAHTALYWWLDGQVDLNDAQSARARADIDRLLAWHRRNELPVYADRLAQWQALALQDLSGAQVCAEVEHLRSATQRLMDQGHGPLAHLALSLSPAQLQHLEREQGKSNERFEKDFLQGPAAQRLERRASRSVDRYAMLYGDLTAGQKQQVRQSLERSPFDPQRTLNERRARQAELLGLIRQWQSSTAARTADGGPSPATAQALQAWLQRGLLASPSADSERSGWVRHGCDALAALHNSTSPAQRQQAQQKLAQYERDLRALAAQGR